jgi:hemoglobin
VRPSLYEFAGGMPAFSRLAAAHHARCLADPELSHPFMHPDANPAHIERLAAYWAEVMGGPATYSRALGDHSGMLRMHAGEGAMDDLGQRFIRCFALAADDAKLPADPEFRAAMDSYMRWAVAEVLSYPDSADEVPTQAPMPHWGWDGAGS